MERLVVEVGNAVKEGVVDVSELKSGFSSLRTLLGSPLPIFDVDFVAIPREGGHRAEGLDGLDA